MSFTLSDGMVINSHGFRIRTAGIKLTRFLANPVMLDQHYNSTAAVIGRWKNISTNGALLIADAEFDIEDENAAKIQGKVERGFLKGVSIGITFERDKMKLAADNVWELEECELIEASIVAVPSNANALKLYSKQTGKLMTDSEIKLCLSATQTFSTNTTDMELLEALIELLGLENTATDEEVLQAVKQLKEKELKAAEERLEEELMAAIVDGRITMSEKEFYKQAGTANLSLAIKQLRGLKKRVSLAAMTVHKPKTTGKNLEWYRQNEPQQLFDNPALLKSLLEAEGLPYSS